jgi:hypothetical protein
MAIPPDYRISLDPADLQLEVIHGFLSRSYWSPGIPLEVVAQAGYHSGFLSSAESESDVGRGGRSV